MSNVGQTHTRRDICLRCPQGCELTTVLDRADTILSVEGNRCKLGLEYIEQEIKDPRRVLPTSVRVRGGKRPLVPVWTPQPMPKALLMELARASRDIVVDAPVAVGDVVLQNWRDLGVDLVASAAVPRET